MKIGRVGKKKLFSKFLSMHLLIKKREKIFITMLEKNFRKKINIFNFINLNIYINIIKIIIVNIIMSNIYIIYLKNIKFLI